MSELYHQEAQEQHSPTSETSSKDVDYVERSNAIKEKYNEGEGLTTPISLHESSGLGLEDQDSEYDELLEQYDWESLPIEGEGLTKDEKEKVRDIIKNIFEGGNNRFLPDDIKSIQIHKSDRVEDMFSEERYVPTQEDIDRLMADGSDVLDYYNIGVDIVLKDVDSRYSPVVLGSAAKSGAYGLEDVRSQLVLAFASVNQDITSRAMSGCYGDGAIYNERVANKLKAGVTKYPSNFDISSFNGDQDSFDIAKAVVEDSIQDYGLNLEDFETIKIERSGIITMDPYEIRVLGLDDEKSRQVEKDTYVHISFVLKNGDSSWGRGYLDYDMLEDTATQRAIQGALESLRDE